MRVLIVPASRYGGTAEIGRAMATTLRAEGLDVDVSQPELMFNPTIYDAFVLGSALYLGDWLDTAVTFVVEHAATIRSRPTWLFSSGPLGSAAPVDPIRPEVVDDLLRSTGAIEHRLFGGRIELDRLPTGERFLAEWVGAVDGDYREWDEISTWMTAIADSLRRRDDGCSAAPRS